MFGVERNTSRGKISAKIIIEANRDNLAKSYFPANK